MLEFLFEEYLNFLVDPLTHQDRVETTFILQAFEMWPHARRQYQIIQRDLTRHHPQLKESIFNECCQLFWCHLAIALFEQKLLRQHQLVGDLSLAPDGILGSHRPDAVPWNSEDGEQGLQESSEAHVTKRYGTTIRARDGVSADGR